MILIPLGITVRDENQPPDFSTIHLAVLARWWIAAHPRKRGTTNISRPGKQNNPTTPNGVKESSGCQIPVQMLANQVKRLIFYFVL